jgi:hypothetical protein
LEASCKKARSPGLTPTHVWRPETAKKAFERTFTDGFRRPLKARSPGLTPTHVWRPEKAKKAFELTFTDGFRNGLGFGSQLQEGTITRPYVHACLAPGEIQVGTPSDENIDISLDLKTFGEHVAETKKPLRV